MGAEEYECSGCGKTVKEAFSNAREEAFYNVGHQGYSGTIAEKDTFKVIPCEMNTDAIQAKMEECYEDENHFVNNKWGASGAIKIKEGMWVFFGIASS